MSRLNEPGPPHVAGGMPPPGGFDVLTEHHHAGILVVAEDGALLYANPAAGRMLALEGPSRRRHFGYPLLPGETTEIELIQDGECRQTVEMQSRPVPWRGARAYMVTLYPLEGKEQLRERLRQSTKLLRAIVEASPLAIIALDSNGRVNHWNHAASRMLGWHDHEVLGQPPPATSALERENLAMLGLEAVHGIPLAGLELHGVSRRDGRGIDLRVWSSPLLDAHGLPAGVMLMLADITEQRRLRAHLRGLAERDPLTALPNRQHFRKVLRRTLGEARKQADAPPIMVLQLDLDRFKLVNHAIGQDGGDHLLKEVATRLAAHLYETDLLARTGADEFSILLRDSSRLPDGARVADRLLQLFEQPFEHAGERYFLGASIGIAVYPHDGRKTDRLLDAVDKALERAKREGGNRVEFFTPDLNHRARNQLALESKLRQAVEREELYLHYQPQYDLAGGRLVGAEALLRWRHPTLGEVSPGEFIPIAESYHVIHQIGAWVLATACRQLRAWDTAGTAPARLAVNISPRQFQGRNFLHEVTRAIQQSGVDPGRIELELTESVLVSNLRHAGQLLQSLKELGVRIAIDDFGTGYSSLAYLAQLPIDTLKIDQSFTRRLDREPRVAAIVQSIGELARGLGLKVIAEGVETQAQLDRLRGMHCHEIQGFLFSRPVAPETLATLLRQPSGDS